MIQQRALVRPAGDAEPRPRSPRQPLYEGQGLAGEYERRVSRLDAAGLRAARSLFFEQGGAICRAAGSTHVAFGCDPGRYDHRRRPRALMA